MFMKKILSFFAVLLMAVTASAQTPSTDFASGYLFGADDAVISGSIELYQAGTPHYLRYNDHEVNGTATWQINATEACFVNVTLNMTDNVAGPKNGGHIFEVKVLDSSSAEVGSLAEAAESSVYTDINLPGTIKIPQPGTYTVQLLNNRAWSKCGIAGVTFTAISIPSTNFVGGYACLGENATLEGYIEYTTSANPNYLRYFDRSPNGTATWLVKATKECYVSATMNMVDNTIGARNGGHIFEVKVLDFDGNEVGSVAEPSDPGDANPVVDITLPGLIHIPAAGIYTIKLLNSRAFSKCGLSGITLTAYTPLYLKPGVWETDGAKYAIYAYNNEGNTWSNFMALAEGRTNIYTATIPAGYGTVIFVRLNSGATEPTWDAKWNQTADLALGEDDLYSITGWGNPSSTGVWSSYADEPAPVVLEDGYYIAGIINGAGGWNVADLSADRQLIHSNEEYEEWYKDVTLAVGDEFKVVYVENNAISTWYPDGNDNNYVIEADHAGDKTVYFRPDSLGGSGWHEGFIYVQPNPVQLTLVAGWNTVCLPYEAEIANVDAYEIQSIDIVGGTISLTPSNGALTAAKSYLINAAAAGEHTATLMGGKETTPVEVNHFIGNLAETPVALNATDANYDYFVLSGNEFHQLTGDATATVNQYKAYIRMAKNASAPSALRIVNGATNIENIESNETAVKFIENGQLFIKKNGVVYDAVGTVVK